MDLACAQHQRRCKSSACRQRNRYEACQAGLRSRLSCLYTVLGRAARNERTGVCRSLRSHALLAWLLRRERSHEMVSHRSNCAEHPIVMGQELHGLHRLLPRLRADVRQVPHRRQHPRHCRIHDTLACDARPERDCDQSRLPAWQRGPHLARTLYYYKLCAYRRYGSALLAHAGRLLWQLHLFLRPDVHAAIRFGRLHPAGNGWTNPCEHERDAQGDVHRRRYEEFCCRGNRHRPAACISLPETEGDSDDCRHHPALPRRYVGREQA